MEQGKENGQAVAPGIEIKLCGDCGYHQPHTAFSRHAKTADGLAKICKVCQGRRISGGAAGCKKSGGEEKDSPVAETNPRRDDPAGTEPDKADRLASETMKIRGDFPDLPHTALYLDFGAYPDMYRSLEEAAREQFRTPEGQILKIISDFLLRQ